MERRNIKDMKQHLYKSTSFSTVDVTQYCLGNSKEHTEIMSSDRIGRGGEKIFRK
jgi:hypothetical protein